jgi:hypothetical protein
MERTADFHHQIADTLFPQTDPIFDDPTAFDTTVDMLDPPPAVGERVIRHSLFQCQFLAAWCLGRHEDFHLREREGQEPQILQQAAPGR